MSSPTVSRHQRQSTWSSLCQDLHSFLALLQCEFHFNIVSLFLGFNFDAFTKYLLIIYTVYIYIYIYIYIYTVYIYIYIYSNLMTFFSHVSQRMRQKELSALLQDYQKSGYILWKTARNKGSQWQDLLVFCPLEFSGFGIRITEFYFADGWFVWIF